MGILLGVNLLALIAFALPEINSKFIRIQRIATALLSLSLISLWLFFMIVFSEPDPNLNIGHVAPFMVTFALLLFAGVWYTSEFKDVCIELKT